MARTYIAASRGLDAVGINPANLALPDDGSATLSILPLGVHIGSNFLNYDLYSTYFTGVETDSGRVGRYLDESDKRRILDAFSSEVGDVSMTVGARLIGLSVELGEIGAFALTVTDELAGSASLPKEFVEFSLYGNPPGSTYDFSNVNVKASWLRAYELSFGTALPKPGFLEWLSGGFGVKLVHGFGYYEIQRFNTTLTTSENGTLIGRVDYLSRNAGVDPSDDAVMAYGLFWNPVGSGYGVDLGIGAGITKFLSVGIAVTDIGSIEWTKHTEITYTDTTLIIDDPAVVQQQNAIDEVLKGKKKSSASFASSLPTTLRVGLALEFQHVPAFKNMPGQMLLALDYNQGMVDAPGETTNPRISLGVEYKPWRWLPIRTGVSFGGTDRMNVAFGFGFRLGFFDLDLASENVNWLFQPNDFAYGSVALGTRFRF
ncbi:MAG: hypothetical protein HY708_03585 [Ignavibacteriae bacterium]|nr:hypothetical protein [Ignavibacteriota bacterium]